VPAVAAVAATVAGVVALSIANTSDQAQAKAQYQPQLPVGMSALSASGSDVDWSAFSDAIRKEAPSSRVSTMAGVAFSPAWDVGLGGRNVIPASYTSGYPGAVLVSDGRSDGVATLLAGFVSANDVKRAQAALAHGSVVAFTDNATGDAQVELSVGRGKHRQAGRFPATYVDVSNPIGSAPTQGIVPPAIAQKLGATPQTRGLLVTGPT